MPARCNAAPSSPGTAKAIGVTATGAGVPWMSPGTRTDSIWRIDSGIHSAGCGPSAGSHGAFAVNVATTAEAGLPCTATVTQ